MLLYSKVTVVLEFLWLLAFSGAHRQKDRPDASCRQLGCDQPGVFTQDGYHLVDKGNMTVAWQYQVDMAMEMNKQNSNYGCVGSSKVVVCPYMEKASEGSRHLMLNPATGAKYSTQGYTTLNNINMPILTADSLVFATNNTHVSLVDPFNNRSDVMNLPTEYKQGVHGSIYLKELGYFVVFGNLSEVHLIYKVVKDLSSGKAELNMVTTFRIPKAGKARPWLPITEPAANGNRVYFYGVQRDDVTGVVALDFSAHAPYVKKAWELSDESNMFSINKSARSSEGGRNCSVPLYNDPEYSIFPPVDVYLQMLATPDNYLVITSTVGLIAVRDHGDSGEQVYISLFGAHFLSLDVTPTRLGHAPVVWMTGWPQYPPFREHLIAFNYTGYNTTYDDIIWVVDSAQYLGADDFNVTSRIASFPDPVGTSRILVFGVSVNTTKVDVPFHQKYCSQCQPGINKMMMALRTAPTNTAKPDILWMTRSPGAAAEVKGQIIGINNMLITFLSGDNSGSIVAFRPSAV